MNSDYFLMSLTSVWSWHKSEVLHHPIRRRHIILLTNTKYTMEHTRTTQINTQIQNKKKKKRKKEKMQN